MHTEPRHWYQVELQELHRLEELEARREEIQRERREWEGFGVLGKVCHLIRAATRRAAGR